MRTYILYSSNDGTKTPVKVLKYWGMELGVPVYEHYRAYPDYPTASEAVLKLEQW